MTIPDQVLRIARVRPVWGPLMEGVDFVPERIPREEVPAARKLLDREGAVILIGWPVAPDSAINAASAILGTRLRQLEKIQERTTVNTMTTQEDPSSGFLHRDGAYGVVDINDQRVQLRIPDPDYVLIFCTATAPAGGESVVIDGYRLVERLRSGQPELYEFLTSIDVDFTSRDRNPDFPRIPRLARIVEWTRGGRMILRSAERAQPAPRDPRWDEHDRMIQAWVDVCETLGAQIQHDTTLSPGEVLVVDNYRCLHGVRRNEGRRTTYILRCKTQDAR
jgi:gamma-butyrobetaine dioxygenase